MSHATQFVPLKQFAVDFGKFGRRGLRVVGEEFQREITRDLMVEADKIHRKFPITERLLRSTRPFSGSGKTRAAGRGARRPAFGRPSMVNRIRFNASKPFGINNAASSPQGYAYSQQIWLGRGFRAGQMRGSIHMRRGAVEIIEAAHRRRQAAGRRAVKSAQQKLRAR